MLVTTSNLENIERILERNFLKRNKNKTAELSKYENDIFTFHSSTFQVYSGELFFETDKPVIMPEGLQKTFQIKYLEYFKRQPYKKGYLNKNDNNNHYINKNTINFLTAIITAGDKIFAIFFFCNDFISELALKQEISNLKDLKNPKNLNSTKMIINGLKILGKL
ncbi:hypothetical protein PAEPH01_2059 [Pancytospora epiphaga]|nr:hypothetical protein PAEPH01_2059 [Pancytospora epiphaga]